MAGTFSARYSPDGQLTELRYPGGLTRTDRLDANLQPVKRTYTRDSDGAMIYFESVVQNNASQVVRDTYTGGSKNHQYNRIGRLVKTQHSSATSDGCVTRSYEYDNRSNRKGKWVYGPDAAGDCQEDVTQAHDTRVRHG